MINTLLTSGTSFIRIPLVKKLSGLSYNLRLLIRETSDISTFLGLKNI